MALFSGSVLLAACSSDSDSNPSAGGAPTGSTGTGEIEDQLNFYHWAEYDDPKLFKQFTDEFGATTKIDIYASNEEMIAKLNAAQGTAGYDIVVPTGVYIPQMVQLGLLAELDLANIPNFKNIETQYTNQPWDPDNLHSVCKDWGSTGWIYDTEAIDGEINTWNDFIAAAQGPASGKTSVLDAPGRPVRHLLLGQRDRLDHRGPGRPRRMPGVHRQRAGAAHQGVRLLSGHRADPGQLRAQPGVER